MLVLDERGFRNYLQVRQSVAQGLPAVSLAHQVPPAERVNADVMQAVGAVGADCL